MGVVKLASGANASLNDLLPVLGTVVVGFGWHVVASRSATVELVPAAIVCGRDGKAVTDDHMVFFNQLLSPDGAIQYVEQDEEQIEVDLTAVPPDVDKVVFVVYADPDLRRPGHFGPVRDAYVRVCDRGGAELVRYDLENPSDMNVTALVFAELYRHRDAWKIRAIGQGYSTGLQGVADDFGVRV